ncbi:MAG: metal-dependent hydrolase [Sphingomonadaceae bacterium]
MSFEGPITAAHPVAIQPRNRRFSRTSLAERWWLNGDPIATAFYNSLSASFPYGEAFFIETLRHFRDGAEPKLAAEIDAFIKQELTHAREHLALNRRVTDAGYDVTSLEARVDGRLKLLREKGRIAGLAGTIALEHITAVFARGILADPRHMKGADPEIAKLWRWHCIEEIEHKGVAFDAWLHATRDWSGWKRWWLRSRVMLFITRRFFWDRICGTMELLRQDGITGPKAAIAACWYGIVRPGMGRFILQGWLAFFRPNFHPWDHDERALIEAAAAIDPMPGH